MKLLQERFNYTQINRESVEGKRLYVCPDGSKVPSVTTILDSTKPVEKVAALQAWRKSVGDKKAQEITLESAGRGTRMHKYLEDFVMTGQLSTPGTNPYSKQSHLMASTIINQGLVNINEIWGTEVGLYYPGLYAGTADAVGVHKDSESIFDYKQTNKPKKLEYIEDYLIQLVFYGTAHNKIHGTNIKKGVILMCVKPELVGSNLSNPQYQEFIIEGSEWQLYESKMWDRVDQYFSNI
jgi:hypothetical protein